MKTFESKAHHEIRLFANAMVEVTLFNPWELRPLFRVWKIMRTTDYNRICLQ